MAGSKTDYLENAVLNYWLGKSFTSTAPATVYIRLYNSTLTDAVTAATDSLEGGTAANYNDVSVTNSSANWTNATVGSKQNKTTFTFTTSASTGWGLVKAFAILATNSTSSGNVLYYGDLTTNQTVAAGNVVQFTTGSIVITES